MKFASIALALCFSLSSFAVTVNGFEVSGVPTASQSFRDEVSFRSDVPAAEAKLRGRCQAAQASAEAFAKNNGFKILSSTGCKVSVDERLSDMAADRFIISSEFTVLFK